MATPQQTDERLRNWLDANQLARERLCQAILSLDKRFASVRPRHPRGGPDGGRDLEAIFQDGRPAFGAIGFLNSVSDSPIDKKAVIKKFIGDLDAALKAESDLKVFIFFTNVSLTLGEKKQLADRANLQGIEVLDLFDRERLRIALDSTDGLAVRHQYLDIQMSDAEQAAFFARWGDDVEELITKSVGAVDSRLDRIQFVQEQTRPLHSLSYHFKLKRELTASEVPYLRSLATITFAPITQNPVGKLHMLFCGDHGEWEADDATPLPGYTASVATFWGLQPEYLLKRDLGIGAQQVNGVSCNLFASPFGPPILGKTLGALDHALLRFFANRTVAEAVAEISVIANEYVVWKTRSSPEIADSAPEGRFPVCFTETELRNEPWVELKGELGTGWLDFSRFTPRRMFAAEEVGALMTPRH